jgi:hypothetical protein
LCPFFNLLSYGNYHSSPTTAQLNLLKSLGYKGPPPKNSREASDEIGKRVPPTNMHKNYLKKLNYSGLTPKTDFDAGILINSLRHPTEKQLATIKKMGGRKIPKSFVDASDIISSLSPVTKGQQINLDRHNILKIPRNRKEASDIINQFRNGTLVQPEPCPKCEGSGTFEDGYETYDPCPYCSGKKIDEYFDEVEGDRIIAERDAERYSNDSEGD